VTATRRDTVDASRCLKPEVDRQYQRNSYYDYTRRLPLGSPGLSRIPRQIPPMPFSWLEYLLSQAFAASLSSSR
jgi:hypothetical protein